MRKKRTYLIILIILAVYFLALYLIWGRSNLKSEKYTTTIMVGDNTIWRLSNKKWVNITSKNSIDKLNWQKFNVYVDNENLGSKYVWHSDKWYIFDKNKQAIPFTGKFLAYKTNYDIKVLDFKEEEISDFTYVHEVLNAFDLNANSKFTTSQKTSVDIDNDGIVEDFYLISNAFSDEFIPDVLFSIVFMVKNEEIYYIYRDVSDNNLEYKECKPYFNYFLDIDNDKTYELILSCGRYSIKEEINMLFKLTEDGFRIIISNQ